MSSHSSHSISAKVVFVASASIVIDAPIDEVWDTLLDFASYPQWNPFVRKQTVVDPDTREPLSDQTAGVGKYMLISPVHMPPTMNDAEALIWPRMPFFYESERSQTLSVLDGKTLYESTEVFGGVLSYIIGFMFKRKLDEGFQAMAQGLKDRCEKTK